LKNYKKYSLLIVNVEGNSKKQTRSNRE
jgi:hypothetical protein